MIDKLTHYSDYSSAIRHNRPTTSLTARYCVCTSAPSGFYRKSTSL